MRPVGADLATSRVTWSVGGALIVDGVDCTVPAGSVTGLLGPNGSGKSTLLRLVAGVQSPDGGSVTLGATDLGATKRRERARLLAFVEQEATTDVALTVLDAVLLGRIPHRSLLADDSEMDRRIVHAVLERLDLTGLSERDLATLSGGERQRVHVARALAQEPSVLLLDEPTNHLDIAAQLSTMTMLGKLAAGGVTVFAALHDLNLAAGWCDHVILLSHGRVAAAGAVADVLVPEVVDDVYGVRSEILRHPTTGRPVLTFTGR